MSRSSRQIIAIVLLLLTGLFWACQKQQVFTPAQQAEVYYNMLINGQYEEFIRGTYGCESLPQDYLSQRVDLLAQHVKVEQSRRGGYVRFTAVREEVLADSTHLVYLDVAFGDSTHECMACPMLRHGDRWVMRN